MSKYGPRPYDGYVWKCLCNCQLSKCFRSQPTARGVHVSIRGTAIRISPNVWNVIGDIDRCFDVLGDLLEGGASKL